MAEAGRGRDTGSVKRATAQIEGKRSLSVTSGKVMSSSHGIRTVTLFMGPIVACMYSRTSRGRDTGGRLR